MTLTKKVVDLNSVVPSLRDRSSYDPQTWLGLIFSRLVKTRSFPMKSIVNHRNLISLWHLRNIAGTYYFEKTTSVQVL